MFFERLYSLKEDCTFPILFFKNILLDKFCLMLI